MIGKEMLKNLKTMIEFRQLPVFMITTSFGEKNSGKYYKTYARCCITKPVEANNFMEFIKSIKKSQIRNIQLPNIN